MAKVFSPFDTQQTLSERTYQQIRRAIVRGQLAPGERLVYRALAEEFGVSPTPVRDAVQRLASEGALELDDRGVATVPQLSADQYVEVMSLRIDLEGRAASAAATRHPGNEFIRELASLQKELEVALAAKDDDGALIANERFHQGVVVAAKLPILASLIASLWLKCGPSVRFLYMGRFGRQEEHPHERLIRAMSARDGPAARAAIAQDLQSAGLHILRQITGDESRTLPADWQLTLHAAPQGMADQ